MTATERGLSLMEVLVVIAIVAILATVAAPSLTAFRGDAGIRAAANDLLADLYFARSYAQRLNTTVTVASASATSDWTGGWQVQCTGPAACAQMSRNRSAYDWVQVTGGAATVAYGPDGRLDTPAANAFTVTSARGGGRRTHGRTRCVAINVSGAPSVRADRDEDPSNGC